MIDIKKNKNGTYRIIDYDFFKDSYITVVTFISLVALTIHLSLLG